MWHLRGAGAGYNDHHQKWEINPSTLTPIITFTPDIIVLYNLFLCDYTVIVCVQISFRIVIDKNKNWSVGIEGRQWSLVAKALG